MADELDLNPTYEKLESLGTYAGWNIVGQDSSVNGYNTRAYVTVLKPPSGGPGSIENLISLELVAKILKAVATLQLMPDQEGTLRQAVSGYISDEPPNQLRNIINSSAEYVGALESRDTFLLDALRGLMQATANPKGP